MGSNIRVLGRDAMGVATAVDETGSLEPVERDLVDHVEHGELLDLARGLPVDEAAMRSWDASQTVHAWVIRDIARGRLATDPDPHGLRLRGARVSGRLDLENITSGVALKFDHCLFEHGLIACDATLACLELAGCVIEHPSEPALNAARLTAPTLNLEHATIRGTVRLVGAHLGELRCRGAHLHNDTGSALDAENLRVDQSVFLSDGFRAVGRGEMGAVRLHGAHVGWLICAGASLRNDTGPALHAENLRVDQSVFLSDGFRAVGATEAGAVRLLGAHLRALEGNGARLRNKAGPALHADKLRVDQSVLLRGLTAVGGDKDNGAVRLLGAHVGRLECDGARLRNYAGSALHADNLCVDQSVFLRDGFKAIGMSADGAVRLQGAYIGGQLDCSGASLRNYAGPALHADNLRVDQSVVLTNRFTAIGGRDNGAIRLLGAHLGGLDCAGARLRNYTGPALKGDSLRVDRNMFLRDGFDVVGGGGDVAVDLSDARVGGVLVFAPKRLAHTTDPQRRLRINGLLYAGLPEGKSTPDWLRLLREGTPEYAAQPYQQLAAAHRSAGHDSQARHILMSQRRDQIHRHAITGPAERAWARFTGLALGYGYQPWRALIGLLIVITGAIVLAILLGGHGGLAQVRTPTPAVSSECPVVDRIGVGLDLGTPLVTTGARSRCEPTTTGTGQVLTIAGWVLRLLAWAFATLFIAGFTGAIRKT
ncbi:hypothetical protein [Actinophytocola sp.]|uniref:hypothetical protein n=1 Tax=Actinophytocola sp. TaxID=1872138 RepID=UPI002DBF3133|nr:hypothetical protein [Actinophytocola sp.]